MTLKQHLEAIESDSRHLLGIAKDIRQTARFIMLTHNVCDPDVDINHEKEKYLQAKRGLRSECEEIVRTSRKLLQDVDALHELKKPRKKRHL